jgi:hypothetical protein
LGLWTLFKYISTVFFHSQWFINLNIIYLVYSISYIPNKSHIMVYTFYTPLHWYPCTNIFIMIYIYIKVNSISPIAIIYQSYYNISHGYKYVSLSLYIYITIYLCHSIYSPKI